jgi:poly(A) polymerase
LEPWNGRGSTSEVRPETPGERFGDPWDTNGGDEQRSESITAIRERAAQELNPEMGRIGAEDPPGAFPAGPLEDGEVLLLLKQAAAEQGVKAWVVGGYVRDKLLGRPHPNPDVVVEKGDAVALATRFARLAGAQPPVTFERYGTAQVTLPGHLVEFVMARAESYAPNSRKPDVRPATLEEDLRRRDFTVNTLLMDFEGAILDPLGGRADLDARLLRTPADPLRTFADDPLRMLRAIRFAADLGFELAPDLLPAMLAMKSRVAPPVISVERVADELRRMLTTGRPKLAVELLDAGGLLEVILPELSACKGVAQGGFHTHDVFGHTLLTVQGTAADLLLRIAALFHDVGKPSTATGDGAFTGHEEVGATMAQTALERLRFSQKEIEVVVDLVRLHLRPVYYKSEWSDGAVRRLARDAGPQLPRLMALARADIAASDYPEPEKLDELQARMDGVLAEQPSRLAPLVSGEDVMKIRGVGPGPEVGRIKRRLEELVIDGEIAPSREAAIEYLASHPNL